MELESSKLFFPDYTFNMFDDIQFIGKGGSSTVARVRHKVDNRHYAIKIVITL